MDPESIPDVPSPEQLPAVERLRVRLAAALRRRAPLLMAVDGVLVILLGVYAAIESRNGFQGDGFLLLVGGLGLILLGVMMILGWNLALVRVGLVGLTAGYFGAALQEFQVATDPCDIGGTFERCIGHVPGGTPWVVYQGPLILGLLLFFFIALEPLIETRSRVRPTTNEES